MVNCGPVGVISMASESAVRGGFVKVADTSMGPGGGCLREGLNSWSNRDGLFVNEAPRELRCSPDRAGLFR